MDALQAAAPAPSSTELARSAPSLVALLERNAATRGASIAARTWRDGRWTDSSWAELARRVRAASDGLVARGVARGDRVAVLSETRLEAVIADLAILAAGAITVPVYPSELPQQCRSLLASVGATWAFCDGEVQASKLRELADVGAVFRFDGPPAGPRESTLAELERAGEARGREHRRGYEERVAAIGPGDVACIIFTSGTTGRPKGVVLTQDSFLYCSAAYMSFGVMGEEQTGLMFLPLAHVMGKMVVSTWLDAGGALAFARSIETVLEDAGETHPTVMAAPPRLFEKAFAAIVSKGTLAPGAKGRLFRMAMDAFDAWNAAIDAGRPHGSARLALARVLVFPKVARMVRERFGGRMRYLLSGSAPLSNRVARFFELIGLPLHQGYGLSETTGVACFTPPGRRHVGTVGPPLPGTEIRLAPDGEVLIRNRGLMRGYWNDPAATAEAFEDGWLRSGDIGEWDGDGCIRITDRKKELIKTSGGKYVAPAQLESGLRADPLVSNAMVHGDGRKFVSALVTLNEPNVRAWAATAGIALGEPLASDPRVRARLQLVVDALNAELPRYATVKRFAVVPGDFSVAGGELTPTLKLRRKAIAERHREVLDAFYAEAEERVPTVH
jgi:long-chain acyl-CoA synthetase